MSSGRFLLFDLGVGHAAAGLRPSRETVLANPGPIFEQWVGLELWRRLQHLGGSLLYLRTRDGAEVDFIVEHEGELTPVEVKWTERPVACDPWAQLWMGAALAPGAGDAVGPMA